MVLSLVSAIGYSQQQSSEPPTLANVQMAPSPDAAALAEFSQIPVSLYTGIPQIVVPIWTLQGRECSLPISIAYHSGGIHVDQVASRVGLGWTLNAGGAITRTVHGRPDEMIGGWMQWDEVPFSYNLVGPITAQYYINNPVEVTKFEQIADGLLSAQPDAFSINYPGGSFRFFLDNDGHVHTIPYRKIKFEIDWQTKTWTVTDIDGKIYTFGGSAIETTMHNSDCGAVPSMAAPTAWYLTKIEGPNGDEINFNYQNEGLVQTPQPDYVTKFNPQIPGYDCSGKPPIICQTNTFHNTIRLESISAATGSVHFNYTTQDRTDLPGSKALERIEIRDRHNNVRKYFDLAQNYWSQRLMLDGLSEHGDINTRKPAYQFSYDKASNLPAMGSFSRDHWGFFNGKPNSELVPRTEVSSCTFVGSADRTPDFTYGKSGILKSITYPAGGSTHFDYEPHDQWAGPTNFPTQAASESTQATCANSPNCTANGNVASQSKAFTLDFNQCVTIGLNHSNNLQNVGECQAKTEIWTQSGNLIVSYDCNDGPTENLWLSAGDYIMTSSVSLYGDFASASVQFDKNQSAPLLNEEVGGLRIARITDKDGFDPANDMVREFEYRMENDPQRSSGILVWEPFYLTTTEEAVWAGPGHNPGTNLYNPGYGQNPNLGQGVYIYCTQYGVSSNNHAGSASTQGSHIGYREVTTKIGAGGSNGKIVSRFTSVADFPDPSPGFPHGPTTSWDHRRGLPTSETMYDANGKKVSESATNYTYSTENKTEAFAHSAAWKRRHPEQTGYVSTTLFHQPYRVISEWVYADESINRTYDENGVDFVETRTTYEYDQPTHAQLTAQKSTDSQARELITRYRYPADFTAGTGPYARAVNKLANGKFMHAIPVEQTISQKRPGQTEEVLTSYLWLFKEFKTDHPLPEELLFLELDQPIPANQFQQASINQNFQYDNRYAFRESVEKVNDYGRVMQILQKDGIRASFKWGYDQTAPVAKVLNGTTADLNNDLDASTAFAGFESGMETNGNPDEDFWIFQTGNDHTVTAHTGDFGRQIAPGTQVFGPTREILPDEQNTSYIFSAWVNTPSNYAGGSLVIHSKDGSGNGGIWPPNNIYNSYVSVPIPATNGQWERVEATLDLGKLRQQANIAPGQNLRIRAYVRNSDPGNKLTVDDLRLQPAGARMNTNTIDLISGPTSASDVNDFAAYFRYDPLLRLEMVRDRDGNIVRKVQYDYKGLNGATHNAIHDDVVQIKTQNEVQIPQLNIGDKYSTVQYVDGFGRQLQTISVGSGPQNEDVVSFSDYDQYGRTPKQWLPYARTGQNGAYVSNPQAEQASFYNYAPRVADSNFPFSETEFDHSPLNRSTEQGAAGADWQLGNGHTIESRYITNTAAHPIRKWNISGNNATAPSIYPQNELIGTHTKDEDSGEFYEFKDKLGRTIYKKVKNVTGKVDKGVGLQTQWLETYWIFDDFGNLAYVIPPLANARMASNQNFDINSLNADLVYEYKYDHRNRLVEKHVPDAGWEFMIYDNLDRQIMRQTENLRADNKWEFTKYDRLGRPIITGIFNRNNTVGRIAMQNLVNQVHANASYTNHERRTASSTGYTDNAFPNSAAASGYYAELSYIYFDHYDFDLDGTPDASFFPDPDNEFADLSTDRIVNHATGTKVRILNRSGISAPAEWIESANFYDQYGRVIHTRANNHNYGIELGYTEYDFSGKILRTKKIHEYNSPKEIKIRNRYTYDHAGRVKQVFQRNNSDSEIILSQSHYNAIGQLVEKNIHSEITSAPVGTGAGQSWLQSVDYGYHIRGWLKNINDCELKNNFAAMNKEFFLEKIKLKVKEKKDQYGNQALYLQVILEKCDDKNGGANAAHEKLIKEIRLMDSTVGNPAYDELHAVKGQNILVNFQYESLAAAKIDQTEAVVIVKVTDALSAEGVSNAAAVTKTVASTCGFLLAQAHTDYVNNDNDDLWGMELAYETGNASLNADQRWNGNITAMCWKSKTDNVKRGYGFRYDVLSRLTSAKYKAVNAGGFKWNFEAGQFDVPKVQYDQNGNISRLNRMGYVEVNGNPSFGAMDKLRYKYGGNQLRSVTDNATVSGYEDFRDNGATTNTDYTYDGNGNLTSDANKGYSASWNHMNLPESVDFGGGKEILWLYDAAGARLKKVVKEAGQSDRIREYVGEAVYQDGALEFHFASGSRIVRDGGNNHEFRFEHFYMDHLGNSRLSYSD
ncbi:MAG: DUF6443 domain-containing protein, partial [Bacteroidota bacterium]